jgi:hypothetical protein
MAVAGVSLRCGGVFAIGHNLNASGALIAARDRSAIRLSAARMLM